MDKRKAISLAVLAAIGLTIINIPSAQAFSLRDWLFGAKKRDVDVKERVVKPELATSKTAKIRVNEKGTALPTVIDAKLGVLAGGDQGIEVLKRTSSADISKTNLIFRVGAVDYSYAIKGLGTYFAADGDSMIVFDEYEKKFFVFKPGDANAPGGAVIKIQAFDGMTGQAVMGVGEGSRLESGPIQPAGKSMLESGPMQPGLDGGMMQSGPMQPGSPGGAVSSGPIQP